MKIYGLPRNTYFTLDTKEESKEVYFFDHLDGMYSYCLDKDENVMHFAAWTDVKIVNKE